MYQVLYVTKPNKYIENKQYFFLGNLEPPKVTAYSTLDNQKTIQNGMCKHYAKIIRLPVYMETS